jgi:hypothetical protein
LTAAILAFFVEPWIERSDTRRDLIRSVLLEIAHNFLILDHKLFRSDYDFNQGAPIYPRLTCSCLHRILSSGLFVDDRDAKLRAATLNALAAIEHFNNYLTTLEIQNSLTNKEFAAQNHARLLAGEIYTGQTAKVRDLFRVIIDRYEEEAELDLSGFPAEVLAQIRSDSTK